MPLLFSYGTLRDTKVQLSLFGRMLVGHADRLPGYEQALVEVADPAFATASGKAQHAILRASSNASAEVEGMAFEVSEAELGKADKYEPAEYERVIARLSSGGQAWVFVASRGGK